MVQATRQAEVSYAVITPVRDDRAGLARLGRCLASQTRRPLSWTIVDNGSTDGTAATARALAAQCGWIRVMAVPGTVRPERGAAVVRALHAGIAALDPVADVIVKVDADVSFDATHLERLMAAFAADPGLGIASGSREEPHGGGWRRRHVTGTSVEGQCRAYRRRCLAEVLPFEERLGWDGLDEMKANARGWRTGTLRDLPFRHHRAIAGRETSRYAAWAAQGAANHYMGYRPSYLCLRALFHAPRDPAALALVWGYATAVGRRAPRCPDEGVLRHVRRQQAVRRLARRMREGLGAA